MPDSTKLKAAPMLISKDLKNSHEGTVSLEMTQMELTERSLKMTI